MTPKTIEGRDVPGASVVLRYFGRRMIAGRMIAEGGSRSSAGSAEGPAPRRRREVLPGSWAENSVPSSGGVFMYASSSLTEAQRLAAVRLFEAGWGDTSVASELGVSRSLLRRLYQRWCVRGRGALVVSPGRKSCPFEVKLRGCAALLGRRAEDRSCDRIRLFVAKARGALGEDPA